MSPVTSPHLRAAVHQLERVSLDETNAAAGLQTRVDRKYVIDQAMLHPLVLALGPEAQVLDIDGEQCFAYRSVYFDTEALHAYFSAAHRRPTRFKVRSRTYVDTDQCYLEIKRRDRRGRTVKRRIPYDRAEERVITPVGRAFVDEHLAVAGGLPALAPVLTTEYHRVTMLDPAHQARLTIDADLVCRSNAGAEVRLSDRLVVETKSTGPATAADRMLWRCGIRPIALSKYCVGMAALDETLPANHWHRTLHTWFGREPGRERPIATVPAA